MIFGTMIFNGLYGKTIAYHYAASDVKGRYLGFSLDNTANSAYSFDGYGRLNKVEASAHAFNYTRLTNSELIDKQTRPNEVDTTWGYETNRNLTTQVSHGWKGVYTYVNDGLGRRTSLERGGSIFAAPDTISYGYNNRSELISAQSDVDTAYSYSFNFDPIGNRLTATLAGTSWNYTANAVNQYTSLANGAATEEPAFDDDGNQLTRNGWTHLWNGENRLVETVKDNTKLIFKYDHVSD